MIQSLEELIVPGRVLRLFCSFTVPPKEKYVVIVATNPFCLGFLFNSSPTELQKSKKHLLDELISISAKDGYAFLTNPEPSILDCTYAADLDFDETVNTLLVLGWRQKIQSRAKIRLAIEDTLDEGLPRAYTKELYAKKTEVLFEHVYEAYQGDGGSIFTEAV